MKHKILSSHRSLSYSTSEFTQSSSFTCLFFALVSGVKTHQLQKNSVYVRIELFVRTWAQRQYTCSAAERSVGPSGNVPGTRQIYHTELFPTLLWINFSRQSAKKKEDKWPCLRIFIILSEWLPLVQQVCQFSFLWEVLTNVGPKIFTSVNDQPSGFQDFQIYFTSYKVLT